MKRTAIIAAFLSCLGLGYALAQTGITGGPVSVPKVTNVGPTDLFQDIVGGTPVVGNFYATAAQISGVQGYLNLGTVTTDPSPTIKNGVVNVYAHGTTTITAVTITMEPNPADGKRICYWADQTTTTLTWTANTGQTIDGNKHAAGVQYISNCMTYVASTATWVASN